MTLGKSSSLSAAKRSAGSRWRRRALRGRGERISGSDCAGIDRLNEKYDVLAHQDSKDFADADTATASSTAGLFSDESRARAGLKTDAVHRRSSSAPSSLGFRRTP
jgi:hypothetical protein